MTLDFCKEVQAHTVQISRFCGADFCPTIAKTLQKLRQLLEGNDSPEPPSCCTTLTPQRMHVQPACKLHRYAVARWQQSFNHAALHACRVSHNNQNARNNRCPCSIVPCGTTISAGAAATPACRPSPRPMHLRVHGLRRPQRGPPVAKATGAALRESNGGRPHVYTYIYI